MCDLRIIECPACDGSGVQVESCWVYEHGCGYGHSDTYEEPCQHCDGTGGEIIETEPITLADLMSDDSFHASHDMGQR